MHACILTQYWWDEFLYYLNLTLMAHFRISGYCSLACQNMSLLCVNIFIFSVHFFHTYRIRFKFANWFQKHSCVVIFLQNVWIFQLCLPKYDGVIFFQSLHDIKFQALIHGKHISTACWKFDKTLYFFAVYEVFCLVFKPRTRSLESILHIWCWIIQ